MRPTGSAIAGSNSLPALDGWKEGDRDVKKIDIAKIPELGTSVGIQGSAKQKEVGGPPCVGVLIGVALALFGG